MFRHAESEGDWPTQVVAGRVTCLPKKPEPGDAMDFRPITVLGLLYRCWGTFQARHAIRILDGVLPLGLFGSRPHCYAGQVWSHLLWSIEYAFEHQLHLCGIVADVQKAFNCLPRAVVMECCALVGMPFHVLRAWAGALSIMPRRFQINGSLSPPALSSCGLPEGCALSCVGMMVIDVLFHQWMTHFFPLCQPLSYVDDWQILQLDPNSMQQTFACLERFTCELDLQLDLKKTSFWSVSQQGRQILRAQGFTLVHGGRNLGAHVQFTKKHTNHSLAERIQGVQPLWPKLRLSACGYPSKVRALKVAAWPRALHGIAANTVSLATFTMLRAGAMKGLHADAAGANSMVHLGLIEAAGVDPQCWSVLQTIHLARDSGEPERVQTVLAQLAAGSDLLPANSITQTLLVRLQSVGWHVDIGGCIHDLFGRFSLFGVSAVEIAYRVAYHWLHVVAASTTHRLCFVGLDRCDPCDTRRWLSCLDSSDQALFWLVLNGSHFTQDAKRYCNEADTDQCPYCLCSDSRYHRFWECSHFEHLRVGLTEERRLQILHSPEALTCSGWSLAPTTLLEWNQYFAALPTSTVPHQHLTGEVHFFTDGSCYQQNMPDARFAGWAVILASTQSVYEFEESCIADSGVLPGLLQSAIRAEIFAVWRVLQMAQRHAAHVFIWTDCEAVVKRFRRIQVGHFVKTNSLHADLWLEIQQCLRDRGGLTSITHVSAHQSDDQAPNLFAEWCFRHNALADKQANAANMARPGVFWDLFHRHVQAIEYVGGLNRDVQRVILSISQEVVRNEAPVRLETEPPPEVDLTPCHPWTPLPALRIPAAATRWYGDHLVRYILSWFWDALDGSVEPVRWISHCQLYADFMLCTGQPGPIHDGTRWSDGAAIPFVRLKGYAFRQRVRWFVKLLKESIRHLQIKLQYWYGRPFSQMVLMHTGLIALPWPAWRLRLVDQWMLRCSGSTYRRQCKAIDALPVAERHIEFPPVFLSSTS